VKRLPGGHNRLSLFRTYLFLVAGLLTVAVVLDFGFGHLQSSQETEGDRWLEATFHLIESELSAVPKDRRSRVAASIGEEIGVDVRLLQRDEVHMSSTSQHRIPALVDADGNASYLHDAASINAIIRLGPVIAPQESLLLRMLPPLFYLSIFVVVGVWLRPLLKDVNLITDGAQRFAADYREPLSTAESTTELTGLAKNIDDMSSRLSGLIRSQKELIAALSHEMRTPLARIRFALAVMGDKDEDGLRQRIDALNDDVQEIDDLIASMLSYARLDHPDIRMHWQDVPIDAWLHRIVEKSNSESIAIATRTEDGLDRVWMDSRLMELALSNLLVNACRYGDGAVRCSVAKQADGYLLSVEDDGKGIPETERETVFKAFTRIDDSRNRDTGGYGLGLAIVARIAALHGGEATVDTSADLGGAKFSIRWAPRQDRQ
jgi:signal transduction histidine kinase